MRSVPVLSRGAKYTFGVWGMGRAIPGGEGEAYMWFNHASNAPLSAVRQDGADGVMLLFEASGKAAGEFAGQREAAFAGVGRETVEVDEADDVAGVGIDVRDHGAAVGVGGEDTGPSVLRTTSLTAAASAARLRSGLGAAITLAEKVKVFTYATSLGYPTSLLFYYPYDLYVDAAPYYAPEHKRRIHEWVGDGLIRASIGLESTRDLIEDLDRALKAKTIKGVFGPALYSAMKKIG